MGVKPALLFPFGWQISGEINHNYRLGEKTLFWGSVIPQKPVENLLFYLHYFSVGDYLPVKESNPKISLIREKPALLFWDIPGSKPVWLSEAESKLKITANSTYWEANL
jgi:hypothetical protein